jgi:hypothetical protein
MSDRESWLRAARRLRRRLNLGVCAARVVPLWTAGSLVFAAALLWDRGRGAPLAPWLWSLFVGFLIVIVIRSVSKKDFFDSLDALVLLEDRLRLRNRLSAAEAGVGKWPSFTTIPPLVRWQGARSYLPPLFAIALVALSATVPIRVEEPPSSAPVSEPLAWREMERALDVLREEELVSEEAIETFEERLEALKSQPKEEWFEHGNLEASDSLREELSAEMRSLVQGLEELEASLGDLQVLDENAPREARRLREARVETAISDLELLTLPLDRKRARELQVLARERNVRRMTKEELEKWKETRERLYHGLPGHGETVVAASGESAGGAGKPGQGGVNRGPGTAPLDLSGERTELGTERTEGVSGEDVSRGLFGDTVGVSMGEHDVDTSGFRVTEAGAIVSTGEGGDVVFRESLTPRERLILQKYFR